MSERVRIGELLSEMGLLSAEQLEEALVIQKTDRRRLGEIIVSEGMVSEAKVTQVLSQQLSVPWVSLEYVDFSRQLLNLVQKECAEAHTLVPIYVRRSKNRKETLYVAIEDPSNQEALAQVSEFSGLPVRPMIAPPSDIRAAIRAYYLGLPPQPAPQVSRMPQPVSLVPESLPPEAIAHESMPPAPLILSDAKVASNISQIEGAPQIEGASQIEAASQTEAASQRESAPQPEGALQSERAMSDENDEEAPESVELTPRDSEMPAPSQEAKNVPKMITLTMLDGTQVTLPASSKRKNQALPGAEPGDLTARDLVEALRAAGSGADASEVLGEDVNWQKLFAALLSLMLQKHLVHDWEFVRELKR